MNEFHTHKTCWVPSGLASRIDWGPPLQKPFKELSVRKLNKVINYAIDDFTITVQAGQPLTDLQRILEEQNQWLSVDWPWASQPDTNPTSSGTVGGLVARGISGSLCQSHLGIRDQIIGIGIIRPDGIHSKAGGKVVKNVAGYDLMRLLCGSWGSLAIITELTFRTKPIRHFRTRLKIDGSIINLENLRAEIIRSSLTPEYIDWTGNSDSNWSLELGLASISKSAIENQFLLLEKAANSHHLQITRFKWTGPLIQAENSKSTNWLIRISLPPANSSLFLESEEIKVLKHWQLRISAGAGIGDLWQDGSIEENEINSVHQVQKLRDKVHELNGQATLLIQNNTLAERLPAWLDSSSKRIITAIKSQFDPKNQLSKGRLPGVCENYLQER